MDAFLDFEQPIATLEKKLDDLRDLSNRQGVDLTGEIKLLSQKLDTLVDQTFAKLTPWQRVALSRHPNRPYTRDYIESLFPDFMELHGDRAFGDDRAIIAGVASWPPQAPSQNVCDLRPEGSVLILGHQKGRTTRQKMMRNFGMARPEGYRKCIRLLEMANRMNMPVLTFIDTPGAYPSLDAEERGQSQAIAESIRLMSGIRVPVVSVVLGEGGSGGALAIGVANRVLMMEYSTYSVISPEGCASILWSDGTLANRASEKLKMTAADVIQLGVVDQVVKEPKGGAHRNWEQTFENLREALIQSFEELEKSSASKDFAAHRLEKFRLMGETAFASTQPASEPAQMTPKAALTRSTKKTTKKTKKRSS